MFRNYFKIAFRNLWRDKGSSAINIFGLAIGLAICLLITLFVTDELNYDRYNKKADRIYRVNAHVRVSGTGFNSISSPAALGPAMVNDYPHIEKAVRVLDEGRILVKKGNETLIENRATFADSTLFDVFTLPMIAGDPETALTQPYSIVLSESMAKKYFNSTDIIGKTLYINNTADYRITGVIKDMPAQSSFHFDFIRAVSELPGSRSDFWLSNNYITYLLVRPGVTAQMVNNDLKQITIKYAEPQLKAMTHSSLAELAQRGDYYEYLAMPLTRIHLYSTLKDEMEPSGNIQYVYIFIVIAVFILLIACVNFMNLSTARSAGRSKEIGIRKVLGSQKISLVFQFLTESVITTFIALVVAILLTVLLLPYFNQLSGKAFTLNLFSDSWLLPSLLFAAVITGLLAGSYPAFFLSSFEPVKVLKGKLAKGFKNGWLRNSLVVFQFSTAIVLIVGTLVVYSQLNYIRNRDLGYNREQVLVLNNIYSLSTHARSFKEETLSIPGVKSATMAGTLPTSEIYNSNAFSKNATLSADKSVILADWDVDADYIPTLGMKIVKGRNFSPEMPTDSSAIIINETAARMLGFRDPLNKSLYQGDRNNDVISSHAYHIIGVVKDFSTGSLRNEMAPVVLKLAENRGLMAFRISTQNTAEVISKIEEAYHAIPGMTGQPFDYSFMDSDFNRLYRSEQRTGKIFTSFAFFAILIACLGLLGLVTYATEQRVREIGVRKVLGASVTNIVSMLTKDFIKLVGVAALIAFPIAWWGMHKWLQDFAYRTGIGWWVFAVAGLLAIIITITTVSFRAVRAALVNPVKSLRAE